MGSLGLVALAPVAMVSETPPPVVAEVPLDDVGPGWSPAPCPEIGSTVGTIACFASDDGASDDFLAITVAPFPPDAVPRAFVEIAAVSFGGDPFATPGLAIAAGRSIQGADQAEVSIVMVAGDSVFNLILFTDASRTEAIDFVRDLARRQQDIAGQPSGGPGTDGGGGVALDRLLLTPPEGSGFEIVATVDQQLDLSDLRSEARSQAVVDLVSRAPTRMRILSSGGQPAVFVSLEELPYGIFAAAELAGMADLPAERLVTTLDLEGLPDAVGFRLPLEGGDGLGVAFRKGNYMVLLITPSSGPDGVVTVGELVALARLQADLLPEGETAPYFFPSAARSIVVTVMFTTVICGGALAVGQLAAARGRRRSRRRGPVDGTPTVRSDQVSDVTRSAVTLRRRGLVLALVDLVALNAIVVGILGITGVLRSTFVLSVTLLAAGVLGGILFTAWWARSELRRTRDDDAFAAELRPSAPGVLGGMVALALLVLGLALVAEGLAGLAFGPSLSGLERSQRAGVDPALLDLAILVAGVCLLILGGFAVRLARTWARTSAERLRARDRRPPILYLRSFEDDALRLPAVVSARRPFLELFAVRGSDPFEEAIAWQVAPYGPVVAIGRPGRSLRSLGAARDHLADDVWRQGVAERMASARAIVVIIGATEGLHWEVAQLITGGHMGRVVFVFPPVTEDVVRERWRSTAAAMIASGAQVPDLPAAPEGVLVAVLDGGVQWRVAVADVRDEATFRVGLDHAMAWLGEVRGTRSTGLTSGSTNRGP
ncbi:MAG: hypothetical protein ACXWXS_06050 [Actinomycetota bacterium]